MVSSCHVIDVIGDGTIYAAIYVDGILEKETFFPGDSLRDKGEIDTHLGGGGYDPPNGYYWDAEIDDVLREGPYELPIADADGDTPETITQASATLAGIWLYEARHTDDSDEENTGKPFASKERRVRQMLTAVMANKRRLDAVRVGSNNPFVMVENDRSG